ncbi:calpain-7 [Holotrichia oblita]|uniref:Calpain-7 n=4 Tax=Holotrichia oblita TaxID=644536 RepID=A0ACB9SRF5_HOLOL|nr:calpain-7 [Holotrichia oblita]KAI4456314.1 calpain-7 [Holotrichia oblita]KAI4456317.1 calpain-7 [Holotrichia oblita]
MEFLRMAICLILVSISLNTDFVDGSVVPSKVDKRSAAPERLPEDYSDFDLKYDDYPLIVPRKRAALLVDRLMVALQKAIEDEEQSRELESALGRSKAYGIRPEDAVRSVRFDKF